MRIIISLFCSFVLLNTGSSFFVDETNSMFMINNQYVISSPLDLKGKTFSVPIGMSIVFKKSGRIENGTIIGNGNTIINPHFDNVSFAGYFLNKDIHISEEAFGDNPDFWGIVSSFSDAVITLDMDVRPAHAPYDDFKLTSFRIQGNRHTIYVNDFPILRNATVSLENIVFDCTGATERVIYAIGPEKEFVIRNCTFINLPEVRFPLCARRFINTVIENCTFQGLLNSTSTRKSVFGFCILLYEVVGKVIVRNNTIQNCFGSGIEGIGFSKESNSEILIEGNIINSVTNGGIVFAGGDVWNVVVRGNLISNTHCLGTIEGEENNKGPNSAINFHGFHNVLIEKNTILDCQNSSCFAFNGQSSDGLNKGYGLTVRNNTCRRTGDVALFHVEKVHIEKNQFENNETNRERDLFSISGSSEIQIMNNALILSKGMVQDYFPFNIADARTRESGRIIILGNTIRTDDTHFAYVNSNFTGECIFGDNEVLSSGRKDGILLIVNNSKSKVSIPVAGNLKWK